MVTTEQRPDGVWGKEGHQRKCWKRVSRLRGYDASLPGIQSPGPVSPAGLGGISPLGTEGGHGGEER